jgi:chromosome transmission fidelity protein 8
MPAVELLIPSSQTLHNASTNPLPPLLQTPSGLAVLEIQGTIHGPFRTPELEDETRSPKTSQIGRLEFPLYNPQASNDDGKWMKKVYLYVGKHQRLTGEVKKLGKPLAVIRKVDNGSDSDRDGVSGSNVREGTQEALEIVDVVKFKVLFSGRPEPVGE